MSKVNKKKERIGNKFFLGGETTPGCSCGVRCDCVRFSSFGCVLPSVSMAAVGLHVWETLRFYRAYLPPAEAARAMDFVVLALGEDCEGTNAAAATRCCTPSRDDACDLPITANGFGSQDIDTRSRSSNDNNNVDRSACVSFSFFLLKKEDVMPPQFKQMLGKVNFCFLLCPLSLAGKTCHCPKAHLLNPDAWRLKLDTFNIEELFVSDKSLVHCVKTSLIRPTAGLFFACGLLHEKIVEAVQPVVCRFNRRCRHGARCLFIHADVSSEELVPTTALLPLRNRLKAHPDLPIFLACLDELGLCTVGDVQQLSDNAFDAIVSRSERRWLLNWLNIATIRDIQPKFMLEHVLATFPDIPSVSLPTRLTTVSSLLELSCREFYALPLPVKIQAACEKIRARFESDRNYHIIDLQKETKGSFFVHMAAKTLSFREKHAHVSWRKNDPQRPVVTCLITYVDSTECACHKDVNEHANSPAVLGSGGPGAEDKHPKSSWCSCRRFHEIGVNYELSTPSGSRCSEQNVLGKLASMGMPTSAVREVFVHGESSGSPKDPNPLFPCGVCENMLRKVTHAVHRVHGGDVMLYMFDSTVNPKRLIYLPISEISHRDGKSFKKFIEDLREE